MSKPQISIPRDALAEFCRRHHIRKLWLYGSVLRDDFRPDSDVDVLVEFEPGCLVGFAILDMEEELSRLFGGRKVEIVEVEYLNRWLRSRVLAEAEVVYEEGRKTVSHSRGD